MWHGLIMEADHYDLLWQAVIHGFTEALSFSSDYLQNGGWLMMTLFSLYQLGSPDFR